MRKFALVTPFLLAALSSCVEAPPPAVVPISAAAEDLFVLEGEWSGQYWSADTGRSGSIRFSLVADEGRARGDVLMLPPVRGEDLMPANLREPASSEFLAIEFVRVDAASETISGTLEPYRDPECKCIVATTFTGTVSRDSIEGTFVTQAGGAYRTKRGQWRVERRESE